MDSLHSMAPSGIPKTLKYSCSLCTHKKIKCDRQIPCSNCKKAGATCIPFQPSAPRRRKQRRDIDVNARLIKCEALLKIHGLDVDEHDDLQEVAKPEPSGTLISTEGKSRFIDNNLWTELLDELSEPKRDVSSDDNTSECVPDGSGILFSSVSTPTRPIYLHPSPVNIFRLWQLYLDNVNPLSKILHTPTIQPKILEASGDIENIPKNLEALMFAIYTAATMSLDEDDCNAIFGESKKVLMSRYSQGTEQALVRVGILQSCDIVTLRALVVYLIGIRNSHDPYAFWLLCGAAVRLGQRMGVHRDGSSLDNSLSVFEAEMRRRLWWQIEMLDARSAHQAGMGQSMIKQSWDTKLPGNYNDSQLNPEMKELPPVSEGPTEMIFILTTFEAGNYFMNAGKTYDWRNKDSITGGVIEKWLNSLEDLLRKKYINYCDTAIPLHLLTESVGLSIVSNKRLDSVHNKKTSLPGSQEHGNETAFQNSLIIMKYDCTIRSMQSMKKFWWVIESHFQYSVFVFLLTELHYKSDEHQISEAWQVVQDVYKCHPELLKNRNNELRTAIGSLVLKAWEKRQNFHETPHFISELRSQRLSRVIGSNWSSSDAFNNFPLPPHPENEVINAANFNTYDLGANFDPNLQMMNDIPMDWEYWNNLIQEYDTTPNNSNNRWQDMMKN